MGTRMAPLYANLFMGAFEENALHGAPHKPLLWWRYIDDIFLIWTHGHDKLTEFISTLNNNHHNIKFTNNISSTSTHFLDVAVILNKDSTFSTDLYAVAWWPGDRGGRGHVPSQRREKMMAPKAPSVLRGCQMPETLIHTKSRWDAQMRQKKVCEIVLPQL